ncbi:MAG: hypothetical protein MUC85_06930 [Anaerolineales bacterium]|jgi:hypothetical protein|nr:hypothetical protein [Anaerolineales bacterium]
MEVVTYVLEPNWLGLAQSQLLKLVVQNQGSGAVSNLRLEVHPSADLELFSPSRHQWNFLAAGTSAWHEIEVKALAPGIQHIDLRGINARYQGRVVDLPGCRLELVVRQVQVPLTSLQIVCPPVALVQNQVNRMMLRVRNVTDQALPADAGLLLVGEGLVVEPASILVEWLAPQQETQVELMVQPKQVAMTLGVQWASTPGCWLYRFPLTASPDTRAQHINNRSEVTTITTGDIVNLGDMNIGQKISQQSTTQPLMSQRSSPVLEGQPCPKCGVPVLGLSEYCCYCGSHLQPDR